MQLDHHDSSLLLLARSKLQDANCLVVTVGLLVDSSGIVVPATDAVAWLDDQFGKQPFDTGLKKSRGTFAVKGTAYALIDTQRQGMSVRVRLGELDKSLNVFPPRHWRKGLLSWKATVSGILDQLALGPEYSYGGAGWADNPVGMGHIADSDQSENVALPRLEVIDSVMVQPGESAASATFLPLPPQHSARRGFIGTVDDDWKTRRAPFLPLDSDPRWFDEVAQDQCRTSGYWRGDEAWAAAGLHPTQATVSGRLPGMRPRLFVERQDHGMPISEALLDLDTIWLFPQSGSTLLLYRTELPVRDIDAEDIVKLAVGCEAASDPVLSQQQWVDRLWPKLAAAPEPLIPVAPPVFDSAAMRARLQASADEIYNVIAAEHATGVKLAQKIAARTGQRFNPADYPPPAWPDIAAFMDAPVAPREPFNPALLEAEIRASVAQNEAQGLQHARAVMDKLGLDQAKVMRQAQQAKPTKAPDPLKIADRLPLSVADRASVQSKLNTGMAEMQVVESQIGQQMATLDSALAAVQPTLPGSSALGGFDASGLSIRPPVAMDREQLEALHTQGKSLESLRLKGLDLTGIALQNTNLANSVFEKCVMVGVRLDGSDLRLCQFIDCDLKDADLKNVNLNDTLLQRISTTGASFNGASLVGAYILESDFSSASAVSTDLTQARFKDSNLKKADFSNANLSQGYFQNCDLSAAVFVSANVRKANFFECVMHATDMRRSNLQSVGFNATFGEHLDLRDCNLRNLRMEAHCSFADIRFDNSDLSDAGFEDAQLLRARMDNTRLDNALLTHCDFSESSADRLVAHGAYLTGCNLTRVNWSGANLLNARLRKVCLEQADLRNSNLHGVSSEGVYGAGANLEQSLMTRCRLQEDLRHG